MINKIPSVRMTLTMSKMFARIICQTSSRVLSRYIGILHIFGSVFLLKNYFFLVFAEHSYCFFFSLDNDESENIEASFIF